MWKNFTCSNNFPFMPHERKCCESFGCGFKQFVHLDGCIGIFFDKVIPYLFAVIKRLFRPMNSH